MTRKKSIQGFAFYPKNVQRSRLKVHWIIYLDVGLIPQSEIRNWKLLRGGKPYADL
jgi:hypothetical protein